VRIAIIGGGPGGLYTATLLKLADPGHEVVVYERNAADDTFGFGVVFSAATLAELEDADGPSFDTLMRACARWDPVEILCRDERIRAHGNRFAAVSRHELLRILQERAEQVGAELRFCEEVDDPAVLSDADLVVGADGVNSVTRGWLADEFSPQLVVEGCKYIWLGTTRPFDAFTFIFKETEHGLFQAHIYPYSETMATFIVECTAKVWRGAGLDRVDAASLPPGVSDEHSIGFLEDLFADELAGCGLVGNNSKWLDWTTVRNARWSHRNVVLLGDAAHTAHFSIGSGTKLALEDAIQLAGSLDRHRDLGEVLWDYESARRPAVLRVQEAAAESLDWFARYHRYWSFDPPQLAYSLLTRSRRVDYDNLRRRDPELVLALDRWYAEKSLRASHSEPLLAPPPPALTPATVGRTTLRNRLVLTASETPEADEGVPSGRYLDIVRTHVVGGAALMLVELVSVSPDARITPEDVGLYTREQADVWRQVTADAGPDTALLGVQLVHAGARGATRPRDRGVGIQLPLGSGWPVVAASPLA
jgi:anthraniloyl-CoA monooxygenase